MTGLTRSSSAPELSGASNTSELSRGANANVVREAVIARQSSGIAPTQRQAATLEQGGAGLQNKLQLSTPASGDNPSRRPVRADIQQVFNKLHDRIHAKQREACHYSQKKSADPQGNPLTSSQRRGAKAYDKELTKALNTLNEKVRPIVNKQGGASGTLSIADTAKLSLGYEKVSKQLPPGSLKELTGLLGQHLKSDWMQMENEKRKEGVLKKVAPLFEPGAGQTRTVSVAVKGGASLLDVPGTGANVGPYADLSISASHSKYFGPDDEGLCFEDKAKSIGIGLSAGAKAKAVKGMGLQVGAEGKLQYTRNDFVEYSDPKDYVNKRGHTSGTANRDQYTDQSRVRRALNHIKPGSELKHLKSEQQKAANSQHRLNDLLASELKIDAKVSAPPPDRSKPLIGHYHTFSAQGKLGASATNVAAAATGINAGGSIGVTHKGAVTNLYEFVPSPLSDVIAKNASRLNELPPNLTLHARELMNGSQRPQDAATALGSLGDDVGRYYEVVQRYDDLKSGKSVSDPLNERKEEKAQLKDEKHSLENKWGAIGRHQFLQVASASHAHLTNIAMPGGAEHSVETTNKVKETAAKIQFPEISHSKQRLDKIASFQQLVYLKISDQKTSMDVSIGPFAGRLDVLQRERVHPSRVREGSYKDISLTGTISGSVQSLSNKAVFTAKLQEAAAKQGIELPGDLDIAPDAGGGVSWTKMVRYFKPKYTQEPGYEGDKGFRRQFVRNTETKSVSAGVGLSGTVAPGAHAGGKISVSQDTTHVKGEKLGTDDLTYTMSRYNRMFRDAGKNPDNERWNRFQQDHKAEYGKTFEHMGDSKRGVHKEAQHFLNELVNLKGLSPAEREEAKTFKQEFNQAMSEYRDDPGDEARYEKANRFFNSFLEKQTVPWWEAHTGTWTDLKFDQGPDSGLDKKTRVAKKLGISRRANEQAKAHPQQSTWYETKDIEPKPARPRTLGTEPSSLRESAGPRTLRNEPDSFRSAVRRPSAERIDQRGSSVESQNTTNIRQDEPAVLRRQPSVSGEQQAAGPSSTRQSSSTGRSNEQVVTAQVHRPREAESVGRNQPTTTPTQPTTTPTQPTTTAAQPTTTAVPGSEATSVEEESVDAGTLGKEPDALMRRKPVRRRGHSPVRQQVSQEAGSNRASRQEQSAGVSRRSSVSSNGVPGVATGNVNQPAPTARPATATSTLDSESKKESARPVKEQQPASTGKQGGPEIWEDETWL